MLAISLSLVSFWFALFLKLCNLLVVERAFSLLILQVGPLKCCMLMAWPGSILHGPGTATLYQKLALHWQSQFVLQGPRLAVSNTSLQSYVDGKLASTTRQQKEDLHTPHSVKQSISQPSPLFWSWNLVLAWNLRQQPCPSKLFLSEFRLQCRPIDSFIPRIHTGVLRLTPVQPAQCLVQEGNNSLPATPNFFNRLHAQFCM